MTCPRNVTGVHRSDPDGEVCRDCGRTKPALVESRHQPWREPIKAKEGAGAYGRSAQAQAADYAARKVGSE